MRSRGREGERARMAQMEPDKKGRVLQKRGRETGDNTVNRDRTSAWDSGNTTGRQSADVNSHLSSRHKLKKKSFSCVLLRLPRAGAAGKSCVFPREDQETESG